MNSWELWRGLWLGHSAWYCSSATELLLLWGKSTKQFRCYSAELRASDWKSKSTKNQPITCHNQFKPLYNLLLNSPELEQNSSLNTNQTKTVTFLQNYSSAENLLFPRADVFRCFLCVYMYFCAHMDSPGAWRWIFLHIPPGLHPSFFPSQTHLQPQPTAAVSLQFVSPE